MSWARACDSWPPPWAALEVPGGWWWITRVLAYRDMVWAIEHEQPIDDLAAAAEWSAEDGW